MFADSAVQSMAAAQQVSCLVAAKCTSKLQITDCDFAKKFKKPWSGRSSFLSRTSFSMLAQWFLLSKRWQQRIGRTSETGKLEEVCSQSWAKELGLSMGSTRICSVVSGQTEVAGVLRLPSKSRLVSQ